jgi:DNA-directed RNA polymerase specialized sigma24 family protein
MLGWVSRRFPLSYKRNEGCEIVDDAILKALDYLKYHPDKVQNLHFGDFLLETTKQCSVDYIRRKCLEKARSEPLEPQSQYAYSGSFTSEIIHSDLIKKLIRRAQLSEIEEKVIVMELVTLNLTEISKILKVTPQACGYARNRAIMKLKKCRDLQANWQKEG